MSADGKMTDALESDGTPQPPISEVIPRSAPVASLESKRGRSYAELDGGQGREVFFRPHRYQRGDLGPVRPIVRIVLASRDSTAGERTTTTHECALHDISQNGVAFEWPAGAAVEAGMILRELAVSFDDHEAYSGQGRIRSVREIADKTVVGVSFTDSLMNVHDVLHLRDVRSWNLTGTSGLGLQERPWQVEGCERFKALVGDLRLLLDDASKLLARVESSLPWSIAHGDRDSPARRALIERIHDEFIVEFLRRSEEIDAAFRTVATGDLEALQEYSRRQIQEYFLQAPCMHRAFYKPLGYPGDYELMKDFYEVPFSGPTLFAKSMGLAILLTRPVHAVRTRKDAVKRQLAELIDRRSGRDPLRVLSIAAGPAQEVYEFLRDRTSLPCPLEIVLFDQDDGALSYAYSRLRGLVDSKWPNGVRIIYLHDSIKRLLKDPTIFSSFGHFDVIFCCGLFDYLALRTAVMLCRNLFQNLQDGGTLYIGNMVPTNPNRWFMELHLDWFLLYRSRSELMDLARLAAPNSRIDILEEATGFNPFVSLGKT
jgi:extracellular factor (EF) 3-hydroxypalmitic acid methyl ester biosynthesis protein